MFKNTFDENRTFGIEIEFFGVTPDRIAATLTNAGIICHHEGYNHIDGHNWKIIYDSSVNSRGTNQYGGNELVSPPLKGREGLEQIRKVCEILNANGASVDKTCGLHVHHDAHDFSVDTFKNLYYLYIKYENLLDSMMPESRRGNNNQYCRSTRGSNIQNALNAIKNCKTVNEIRQLYNNNRYHKLNLEAFVRHGTIEFRQHSGTTDAEKIINWIVFTQMMINSSANTSTTAWNFVEEKQFYYMLKKMKATNTTTDDELILAAGEYYKSRIKALKRKVAA